MFSMCFGRSEDRGGPAIRGHEVACVITYEDLQDLFRSRHWTVPYTYLSDTTVAFFFFERPQNGHGVPTHFVLTNITVSLPDSAGYATRDEASRRASTISFYLNIPEHLRPAVARDTPLSVLAEAGWDVFQPHTRYATLCPRSFRMNGVAYAPCRRHSIYGQFEDLAKVE